ncbi:glycoside hydrolase [Lophiotrema nucula]|uniref:Glycoside hydrolase n=1 Tax=Lophiotrema nucula TaxID=690887 RepID=A0A6A5YNP3_9PLEO|nr:glycoside hydrolase [Lophiotrema nucula]
MLFQASFLVLLSSLASVTLGHSFLEKVWANGMEYKAWDPNAGAEGTPYPGNTPSWFTTNKGGNPLKPNTFNTRDIVCALNSSPGNISAPINAGSTLTVKWWMGGQPFPPTHWGPVVNYIAACNGACSKANPLDLKFLKLDQKGWERTNTSYPAEGYWATNELVDNNGTWPIKIPEGLKAGEYVVRHELIALHVAFEAQGKGPYYTDGAESYPQCVSVKVGGTGTRVITGGVAAAALYKGDEPGMTINIHDSASGGAYPNYEFPGPAVWPLAG